MSQDAADTGYGTNSFRIREKEPGQHNRENSLADIVNCHQHTGLPTKKHRGIGCAQISAAAGAEIHLFHFAYVKLVSMTVKEMYNE